MRLVWILATYAGALAFLALMNWREFKRDARKEQRYKALPLPYKFVCWFGITPMVVAVFFVHAFFIVVAGLSYIALHGACVRWYQKNGLLP